MNNPSHDTSTEDNVSQNVKTNLPGLIRGSKPTGAVGAALLEAARKAAS